MEIIFVAQIVREVIKRGRLLKLDRFTYSLTIALQSAVLMVEFFSFSMLLLIDPHYFRSYVINSKIDLTPVNRVFFAFLSLFESPSMKLVGVWVLTLFFLFVIYYFILLRKIWVKPVKESVYFTGIVLLSTSFFCFLVINFWDIYSRFL
ncbi:MAG: hypothetical protein K8T10_13545 [Candidatus Eremiobacteraeota bacterium]|nr:hypothetical protein [Candidatus Eremiobacteraeota bacterium]